MTTARMSHVKAICESHGSKWFEKGAMRFFSSKLPRTAKVYNGAAYFISSEQFDAKTPRMYSIREANLSNGKVNTIGKFQQYATMASAKAALTTILEQGETK